MPELPEVEITKQKIKPLIKGRKIEKVSIFNARLRWTIASSLPEKLEGQVLRRMTRRGKYLLLHVDRGTMLMHLGMSGSLRIALPNNPRRKHDHVEFIFAGNKALRFHDPRRFGCILWTEQDPLQHELLAHLGPEPLGENFSAEYLFQKSRKRQVAVKNFIMNARVVVGIGNIYANEALFLAGVHPLCRASKITRERYAVLVKKIRQVLSNALRAGGTTLRDFSSNGEPGYFKLKLLVYDRADKPCKRCNTLIKHKVTGQRSTYFCPKCQI